MSSKTPRGKDAEQFHRNLVDRLVLEAKPVRPIAPLWTQWLAWAGLSMAVVLLFLIACDLQDNAAQIFSQWRNLVFVSASFAGSGFLAWEALAASIPGRQTGKVYKTVSFLLLGLLTAMPFAFFYTPGQGLDLAGGLADGRECAVWVGLIGLLPWAVLGYLVSGNASFKPARTGAWAGASAFLLGSAADQLHCPTWEAQHIVAAHLLPVVFLTFLAAFAGSFWFSRWKR
jgi:hypothetical protein